MKLCTVSGKKEDKVVLDPVKMNQLRGVIRSACDGENDSEFEMIWCDIKTAIGQACKNIRHR